MDILKSAETQLLENEFPHLTLNDERVAKEATLFSLEKFITKFFTDYNDGFNTYAETDLNSPQTFKRKKRSLTDVFRICRFYYPNCAPREVIELLYKTIPRKIGLVSWYCPDICRRVWWFNGHHRKVDDYPHMDSESSDEFGFKPKDYLKALG